MPSTSQLMLWYFDLLGFLFMLSHKQPNPEPTSRVRLLIFNNNYRVVVSHCISRYIVFPSNITHMTSLQLCILFLLLLLPKDAVHFPVFYTYGLLITLHLFTKCGTILHYKSIVIYYQDIHKLNITLPSQTLRLYLFFHIII